MIIMNRIGSKLKKLRHDLGLTQKEMAADVISVSFYSKVERGFHDIGAEELIQILEKHGVSFQEFFSETENGNSNDNKINYLKIQLAKAANEDNDTEIGNIITQFEQIVPQTGLTEFLTLQAKIISNTHDDDALSKLSEEEKKKIKQVVFQKEMGEDGYLRIVLISNIMELYTVDEATFLVHNMIRRYQNASNIEKKVLVALSVLMINYVDLCLQNNKTNLCSEPLNFLRKLPNTIELAFTKILGKYYENVINGNQDEANQIKKVLIISGYEVNVDRIKK
ncbi:helix-turn-helix domain-containing protein [Lactobacillus sp. M0403]|uniref:helix-turn-helix domain-containing protein n=1 Tax=Lactobacillus sp. M0403 TaxID=2751031 RepID=UPI0018DE13F6|nr:helix-turn-helix transcriptional regulator [Lactobacillus sp. M0403]MBI0092217.1 helix-turn-helix domain-containing protein [Lactobacillus sp. M0403]MCT6821665.1 helix-turn-helix transcriptional regulator [Lactobacillus apis]